MQIDSQQLIPEMLEEYGRVTRHAFQSYLLKREPRRHLYDLVADYPMRSGRMLRSSLVIAATRAFGGSTEHALNSAVALELMHNAFLVHDDVEDDGLERRGRPALHKTYGVPMAVNVGDALSILSLRPLLENRFTLGPHLALRILEENERMVRESIEGQAIELGWRRDNALGLQDSDYLRMVLKKTCWYTTIYPLRVGALIGTRGAAELDSLIQFGFFLGAAFQIQDDVLNLIGDHQRYGKEINGDIWEGKRTLMMIHLLQTAAPDELARLAEALANGGTARSAQDVSWIRERMDFHGSVEYARQVAHALAGAAVHEFDVAFGGLASSKDQQFIAGLPEWVLRRL
jgi:geranylgeranyl diphosphate synthase type II